MLKVSRTMPSKPCLMEENLHYEQTTKVLIYSFLLKKQGQAFLKR